MVNLKNLKKLISENGRGGQKKLADAIQVSTGNVNDWLNPNKNATPSANALYKIADYYDCSIDYILGRTDNPKIAGENAKIYRFPVYYEQEAAAGVGILNQDSNFDMEEYIIDNIPNNAVYAIKISGESMYSEITDYKLKTGSVILVNPKFLNSEIEDKIVIVNFEGKTICKRCIDKGNYFLFQSDNEEYENDNRKSSDDPNCKILGVVVGVIDNEKFISI